MIRGIHDGNSTNDDLLDFYQQLPNADRQFVILPHTAHSPGYSNNRHLLWYATRNFLAAPAAIPRRELLAFEYLFGSRRTWRMPAWARPRWNGGVDIHGGSFEARSCAARCSAAPTGRSSARRGSTRRALRHQGGGRRAGRGAARAIVTVRPSAGAPRARRGGRPALFLPHRHALRPGADLAWLNKPLRRHGRTRRERDRGYGSVLHRTACCENSH